MECRSSTSPYPISAWMKVTPADPAVASTGWTTLLRDTYEMPGSEARGRSVVQLARCCVPLRQSMTSLKQLR